MKMLFQRCAPMAATAALLFTVGCDKSSEPLSPSDGASFAAGGNDHRSARGHVVNADIPGFITEYTFSAKGRNGDFTGHISATITGLRDSFFEGDVNCLSIVPGTTHARMTAIITSTNFGAFEGHELGWTVTDGGNGAKASPDAASPLALDFPNFCAVGELGEVPNDENKIKVKA